MASSSAPAPAPAPEKDHPVWASLVDLLESSPDGETLATQCLLVKNELTPMEFLVAAAAQCFTIEPWPLRVELFKACAVAIRMGGARVHGFAQTIFEQLLKVASSSGSSDMSDKDEQCCCELVALYAELVARVRVANSTPVLLRAVYDPLLTRVSNTLLARRTARRVIRYIERDLKTLTLQEMLLPSAFAEKHARLEEEQEEQQEDDESLSEWDDTSDSTDSGVDDDKRRTATTAVQVPHECSAAVCFFLAPELLVFFGDDDDDEEEAEDAHVLSAWGRFKWAQPAVRYLLRNTPTKSLAAQRAFDMFCEFEGGLRLDNDADDVVECVAACIQYAWQLQSLACRDQVKRFITSKIVGGGVDLSLRLAQDASQLQPGIRAWMLDVLRGQLIAASSNSNDSRVQRGLLSVLNNEGEDLEVYCACFGVLRAMHPRWRATTASAEYASEVVIATRRIHRTLVALEQEIDPEDEFELRASMKKEEDAAPVSKGKNCESRQADLGRARLAASFAEGVLELWAGKPK